VHVGIVGGQPPAELHQRSSGQIGLLLADMKRVAPSDIKAEGIQRLLVAQVVQLLEQA
jgi:hypothetical protein